MKFVKQIVYTSARVLSKYISPDITGDENRKCF